ncbi:MAG: ATP-binding protein [Nitrospirae bacterium]|nr:ATP-binding protein [Nitrospirota bacterium]
MDNQNKIKVDLSGLVRIIGDKLYSTPYVFIRENVQNAIDALRLLPTDGRVLDGNSYVKVTVTKNIVEVEDTGIGMSEVDLSEYFWNICKTSKNNEKSQKCNVIGRFGVGAFANFKVCSEIEVHTWRKGFLPLRTFVSKSNLEKNIHDYDLSKSNKIKKFGTHIIGKMESTLNINDLHKYLMEHVKYLNENVYFNGEKISTKKFQYINKEKAQLLYEKQIEVININLNIAYYEIDSKIVIEINSKDISKVLYCSLNLKRGQVKIYLNNFLLTYDKNAYYTWSIGLSGLLNSNILEPDVTREGLDEKSTDFLNKLLEKVNSITIDCLSDQNVLFDYNSDIISYIAQQPFKKIHKYLDNLDIKVFGKKDKIKLRKLIDDNQKINKILISETESIPAHIKLMKDQGVATILLNELPLDIKPIVIKYLKENCSATMISDFEIKSIKLDEASLTIEMKSFRSAFKEVLQNSYFVKDPIVVLCKSNQNIDVSVSNLSQDFCVNVNVESENVKLILKHTNTSALKMLIDNLLCKRYLFDVLVKFLPDDITTAMAMFNPKPHKVIINDVSLLTLIRSNEKVKWSGPEEDCIKVESTEFKDMEGYYIKIPDYISEHIKPQISVCKTPEFVWLFYKLTAFFTLKDTNFFLIEIESKCILSDGTEVQGYIKPGKNVLVFDTGIYLPIAFPLLKNILPIDSKKELEFSFRNISRNSNDS